MEALRLNPEDQGERRDWRKWGTYLPLRQWGTVREDYSKDGESWDYLDYDSSRSRVYRWGEDGLFGWCDSECRVVLAPALWNGQDDHLKEKLFGLTGPQGNHGEDVKEIYYFLDATPTHSYAKARYRYPLRAFPYQKLLQRNSKRGLEDREYEIEDTGIFSDDAFVDVDIEYAKATPDVTLVRYTVSNRGRETATLSLLAQIFFRNVWKWGRQGAGYGPEPEMKGEGDRRFRFRHEDLGSFDFICREEPAELLFTDNEDDSRPVAGGKKARWTKDAFHRYLVKGDRAAINPEPRGTKGAALYQLKVEAGQSRHLDFILAPSEHLNGEPFADFDTILRSRREEADEFYDDIDPGLAKADLPVWRQACAGLLWSKQFYNYAVGEWFEGDPNLPAPREKDRTRNQEWKRHLYNRDILLVPDRWEYPWYAAWDVAFHAYPMALLDPEFAKEQLLLMLRERYMHPSGQLPSFEFDFSEVNPPVHAWACLRVFQGTGSDDLTFLERAFHKLLINFTWWVNRTDDRGDNVFSGGFLGMDNIGVFDRSSFPEELGELKQADATAWMGFFALGMMRMALHLAEKNCVYEDIASKFFEHFVTISLAVNSDAGKGLWDEEDRFFYDFIEPEEGDPVIVRVRSLVGLLPLIAMEIVELEQLERFPGFRQRMEWFLDQMPVIDKNLHTSKRDGRLMLSLVPEDRLRALIERMLDEQEFLSPFGIRSLSKAHLQHPYTLEHKGERFTVAYEPGEARSEMFGGNSNWRGPVWFPINFLLIDALKCYHAFYGERFQVEMPTGSGREINLLEVAGELQERLVSLFRPGPDGAAPCYPASRARGAGQGAEEGLFFHEYFHGETGEGLGACHQTGWTALVARCLGDLAGVSLKQAGVKTG